VYLGNGDGGFQPPIYTPGVLRGSLTLVVTKVARDHLSDVVAKVPDGNLAVFLSNGDGTFKPPIEIPATSSVASVAAADLTGSGIADLVAASANDLEIFMGNGDGTFQTPTSYTLPVGVPTVVAIGDFNGDGVPDILARDTGTIHPSMAPGFNVLFGNGDGTFQPAIRTPDETLAVFRPLVAADLNNDGNADLVYISAPNQVSVRLNNGDGTFQPAVTYTVEFSISSITVMDINGDGNPDLLVPSTFDRAVRVLLGNGDGSFHAGHDLFVGSDLSSTAVFGDFRGIGLHDIAFPLEANHGIGVRLGNPNGTFQTTPTSAAGTRPWGVAVGDFTHHNIPDLVVTNATPNGTVNMLVGIGDGTFEAPAPVATGLNADYVLAGDFTGSGNLGLVVGSDHGVYFLRGNGDGTFGVPTIISSEPAVLADGDFTGDGKLDLLLADTSGVKLLLGNGDGTFQGPRTIFTPGYQRVKLAVGDFNGDHKLDIAVLGQFPNSLNILLGNGDGTFQPPESYAVTGFAPEIAAGDLLSNGRDDVVISIRGDDRRPGSVSVFLSNADGTLQPAVNYQVGPDPGPMLIGNLSPGSAPGIAVMEGASAWSAASVRLFLGNGDGTFQVNPFTYSLGTAIGNQMVIAEGTGDAYPDIISTNTNDDSVSILSPTLLWNTGSYRRTASSLSSLMNASEAGNAILRASPLAPEFKAAASTPDGAAIALPTSRPASIDVSPAWAADSLTNTLHGRTQRLVCKVNLDDGTMTDLAYTYSGAELGLVLRS
jgi:hypothetical protein